jgi:hypothetical protein
VKQYRIDKGRVKITLKNRIATNKILESNLFELQQAKRTVRPVEEADVET